MPSAVAVLQFDIDREVALVSPQKAKRMVALGQARWHRQDHSVRLVHSHMMPMDGGRTRTSRGGMLAAIGRSQSYVKREISPQAVTGFKTIYPEDRHVFQFATLDARGVVAL